MKRKDFIESHGATCRNWNWSWSFVNEPQRFVIFGAWDMWEEPDRALILNDAWETKRGRKQPGYFQSLEHIRLVEREGYRLKTFPMKHSLVDESDPDGRARIKGFEPVLYDRALLRDGSRWYAVEQQPRLRLPEEVYPHEMHVEGAAKTLQVNAYERDARARAKCIAHHGTACSVCSFRFESMYGDIGREYIHVHHLVPLSEIKTQYRVNPITDLLPVCPNCHAMIHSQRPALSVATLKSLLQEADRTIDKALSAITASSSRQRSRMLGAIRDAMSISIAAAWPWGGFIECFREFAGRGRQVIAERGRRCVDA